MSAPKPTKTRVPRTYYGYEAMGQCCAHWLLLGWPQRDGKPEKIDEGLLDVPCPKCGGHIVFDLAAWTMTTVTEWHQPPALVIGRITKA